MATTQIQDLASIIAYNTAIYNHYLQANNLPTPSHYELPPDRPIRLPEEIEAARQAAQEASHELHELLSGSVGHILNAAARSTRIMVLHFIHTYKVGYTLGWGEKTTFTAIAKECGLDEDDMKRMLRLAMAEYFFTETSDGQVMHTASSFDLARNKLLSAWVGVTVHENWGPMFHISEALKKYPGSEEPLESAYAMAHNLKDDAFKVWEQDPARIEQFSDAMAFLHSDSGFKNEDVLVNCAFPEDTQPVFVDVGGSIGHVSIGLARANPNVKFIVQDSEITVARAKEQLPEDVKAQVEFQVHDFWTEQPIKNADVYFFKTIFHDWSDAYSVKILRQLIPALKKGARVIIADVCIPPKGVVSLYKEQWIRGLDIVMKCFTNAKEREAGDWAKLFEKTDSRFKFLGARTPLGSKASIIEAEWRAEAVEASVINSETTASLLPVVESQASENNDIPQEPATTAKDDGEAKREVPPAVIETAPATNGIATVTYALQPHETVKSSNGTSHQEEAGTENGNTVTNGATKEDSSALESSEAIPATTISLEEKKPLIQMKALSSDEREGFLATARGA